MGKNGRTLSDDLGSEPHPCQELLSRSKTTFFLFSVSDATPTWTNPLGLRHSHPPDSVSFPPGDLCCQVPLDK